MNYSDWASCFHKRLRSVPSPQPRSPPGRCSYMGGFLTTASLCCCEQQAHTDTTPCCQQRLLSVCCTPISLLRLHVHSPGTHTHAVPPQGHHRTPHLASSLCSCDAQRAPRGAQNWHSCHRHSELLFPCHAVLLTYCPSYLWDTLLPLSCTLHTGFRLAAHSPATDTPGTCQTHATHK